MQNFIVTDNTYIICVSNLITAELLLAMKLRVHNKSSKCTLRESIHARTRLRHTFKGPGTVADDFTYIKMF